jgi:hypothetical protein
MVTTPVTVHILKHGRPYCGQSGVPCDWPDGHSWIAYDDEGRLDKATCGCLEGLDEDMGVMGS